MAFKEKVKKFWKDHWKAITLVGSGAAAVTGAICYRMRKSGSNGDETEKDMILTTIEEKTKWNHDWDAFGRAIEFTTHQPLGPFRDVGEDDDDNYIDPLEGNCFIIAGYNSMYNDSPDTLEIYALDNEGYFHRMPDDVYNA